MSPHAGDTDESYDDLVYCVKSFTLNTFLTCYCLQLLPGDRRLAVRIIACFSLPFEHL